jgi:peptide subunit release factor 1 (eRF1)
MNHTFISHQDILDISKHQDEKGTISLYLYSSVDETERDFAMHFDSLSNRAKKEAEKYFPKSKHVKKLIQQVQKYRGALLGSFAENKAQTFCMFISEGFEKLAEVPIRLKEGVVVDREFYVLPLLGVLEQFERFAILVFGRQKARLYSHYLGKILERETIFHDYVIPKFNASTSSWRCLREKKVNHKIDNTYHRHLKEVCRILLDNFKKFRFDKLLLASHQSEINSIKRHLHSNLLPKLAGEFTADADDPAQIVKEKAAIAIAKYRERKEGAKIAELMDSHAHNKAVLGVGPVLDVLRAGNVRQLILTDDFHVEGYVCPENHSSSMDPSENGKCALCGKELIQQSFLEDHIIQDALAQRAEIFHILRQRNMLANYKIGALLRF